MVAERRYSWTALAVSIALSASVLIIAIWGFDTAAHIESDESCFEACFMDSWVPATYALILAASAIINLGILLASLHRLPASWWSLRWVIVVQVALVAAATAWVLLLNTESSRMSMFSALLTAGLSVTVCAATAVSWSLRNRAFAI